MAWWDNKPPTLPPPSLIDGDSLNLKVLSPGVAGILKSLLGKLDPSALEKWEREQIETIHKALEGESYTLTSRGMFTEYGPTIERIKAKPPNSKRK